MPGSTGQERLKVVAGQRLHVHLRAGEQIAHRHGLQALGGGVGRQDHFDAFADEGEAHFDQHLLGDAAADVEGRGVSVREPLAHRLHDVASGRHIREQHLSDGIRCRLRDDDVPLNIAKGDLDGRYPQTLDRNRDGHSPGTRGILLRRLREGSSGEEIQDSE